MKKRMNENREIEKDWKSNLPFEYATVDSGAVFETAEADKIIEVEEKIFKQWYENQDQPILDVIEELKISRPQSPDEFLNNLICDVFLHGKRMAARKLAERSDALKSLYNSERRAQFSIEDARFQQEAVKFLMNCANQEALGEFWQYFISNQETVGSKELSAEKLKRGLVAIIEAINRLRSEGLEVVFPSPEVDARDKIDLVAGSQSKTYFIQVKNAKQGERRGFYNEEYFDGLKPADSGEADQLEKIRIFFSRSADYGKQIDGIDAFVYLA